MYHESLARTMQEPVRGYLGLDGDDWLDRLTDNATRAARSVKQVKNAWEGPQNPSESPKGTFPGGAVVLGVIGLLIAAYAIGGRR